MSGTIDRFIPAADVRERHEALIRAPAGLAFDVAEHFRLQSIPMVRAIFWLRAKLLGAHHEPLRQSRRRSGWAGRSSPIRPAVSWSWAR